MKSTLTGICLLAALSAVAGAAQAQGAAAASPASRWSSSVMDRHMPLDSVQLQKSSQQKFRYMDGAEVKRSRSIRDAVIVYGRTAKGETAGEMQQPGAGIRRPSQKAAPVRLMRPMT